MYVREREIEYFRVDVDIILREWIGIGAIEESSVCICMCAARRAASVIFVYICVDREEAQTYLCYPCCVLRLVYRVWSLELDWRRNRETRLTCHISHVLLMYIILYFVFCCL